MESQKKSRKNLSSVENKKKRRRAKVPPKHKEIIGSVKENVAMTTDPIQGAIKRKDIGNLLP